MRKVLLPVWLLLTIGILRFLGYRAAIASDFASIWGGIGVLCAVLWWRERRKGVVRK